jgi:FixJ family two-component response regulator
MATESGLVSEATDSREAIVHIVDDDVEMRNAWAEMLLGPGQRTHTYASGEEFLKAYDDETHGCLILDMLFKVGMSGLALLNAMKEKRITLPTIVLTGRPQWHVAVDVMKLGAFDYIEKPVQNIPAFKDLIAHAIRRDREQRAAKLRLRDTVTRYHVLTPREREILTKILDDKSSSEIAAGLGLSQKTVEYHRTNMLTKMGVNSTIQLVRILCHADLA